MRRTFTAITMLLGGLVVAVCAALVIVTTWLRDLTTDVTAAVDSVHQVEEAQLALLQHARARDLVVRDAFETATRVRLQAARVTAMSAAELELLQAASEHLDTYYASVHTGQPSAVVAANEHRAFATLESLVDLNLEESAAAAARAGRWDMVANITAFAASVLLVGLVGFSLWWLHRRAFQPLIAFASAVKRFGKGEVDARAPELGHIELRQMSAHFNDMADTLVAQRKATVALLGGVAHDLRTPLANLRLAVDLLGPDQPFPSEPDLRRVVALLDRQIDRLDHMLGDFLDLSKLAGNGIQVARMERDLARVLRDAAAPFLNADARRLVVTAPETPVVASVDSRRIEQAVTNLINNAIKYSPAETPVELTLEVRGTSAVIEVRDHGVGIAPDELPHLFEPFRRAAKTRDVPGLGLGLYMVKRIAEAHGGEISVTSEPGAGSTFCIRLPLVTARAETVMGGPQREGGLYRRLPS